MVYIPTFVYSVEMRFGTMRTIEVECEVPYRVERCDAIDAKILSIDNSASGEGYSILES